MANIEITTKQIVILPNVPNFISQPDTEVKIDIKDLSIRQMKEIGEMWTQALIAESAARKAAAQQP